MLIDNKNKTLSRNAKRSGERRVRMNDDMKLLLKKTGKEKKMKNKDINKSKKI